MISLFSILCPMGIPVPKGNSCPQRELLASKETPAKMWLLSFQVLLHLHIYKLTVLKKKKRKRNMDYAVCTDLQLPLLTSRRHSPGHPLMSAHDCLLSLFQLAWDSTVWTLVCLGDLSDAKWRGSQGLLDRALSFPTESAPLSNEQRWGLWGRNVTSQGAG